MPWKCHHGNSQFLHVQGHTACRLGSVQKQRNSLLPGNFSNLSDWHDASCHIGCRRHHNQAGLFRDSISYGLCTDAPLNISTYNGMLHTPLFQCLQRSQHRIVLHGGGDNMIPFAQEPEHCQIQTLCGIHRHSMTRPARISAVMQHAVLHYIGHAPRLGK